jgi:hypothetical protein
MAKLYQRQQYFICSQPILHIKFIKTELEVAFIRTIGELDKGLILVFQLADNEYFLREDRNAVRTRDVLRKGLSYSQAGYLLGIRTRKSMKAFSCLDSLRDELRKHENYPWSLSSKYSSSPPTRNAQIVSQECSKLAQMGILELVEDKGRWHTTYRRGEGIFDNPESVLRAKKEIASAHAAECWSNGFVTLINHRRLKESGFTEEYGFNNMSQRICRELGDAVYSCGKKWVADWEEKHKVNLDSMDDYYSGESENLYRKERAGEITRDELLTRQTELGKEYSQRVPRFPLVVIDLNSDGMLL